MSNGASRGWKAPSSPPTRLIDAEWGFGGAVERVLLPPAKLQLASLSCAVKGQACSLVAPPHPPLPHLRDGAGARADLPPSPRCVLRATPSDRGCDSEPGPPPGIKLQGHELDCSLGALTLTRTRTRTRTRWRGREQIFRRRRVCVLRATPSDRGCDSEPGSPPGIKLRGHELDCSLGALTLTRTRTLTRTPNLTLTLNQTDRT